MRPAIVRPILPEVVRAARKELLRGLVLSSIDVDTGRLFRDATFSALREALGCNSADLLRTLRELEEEGLLERGLSLGRGQPLPYRLTEAGREAAQKARSYGFRFAPLRGRSLPVEER